MKTRNLNQLPTTTAQKSFHSLGRALFTIPQNGFALIATISVMALLVMIALAMLSLSTVEVRSSTSDSELQRARANARVSLMLAIAELQKTAGADTRITAPADAVAGLTGGVRQLTGVWRSWEGLNHSTNGQPIAPDYGSKLDQGDPSDGAVQGRFLRWLVSSADQSTITDVPDLTSTADGVNRVTLLGSLSSSAPANNSFDAVNVDTTLITDDDNEVTGSYAWWVQGNNTKALLRHDNTPEPQTPEEWSRRLTSYSFSNSEQFGITNNAELSKVAVSFNTMAFARNNLSPIQHAEDFHDLTPIATGLLTNAATGGWKRDLSLFSEKYNDSQRTPWGVELPSSGLSTFNLEADSIHTTGLMSAQGGYLYPWVGTDNISMTWASLADFASLYKKVKVEAGSSPYFDITSTLTSNSTDPELQSHDEFTIVEPTFSRSQFVVAYSSRLTPGGNGTYDPVLSVKPTLVYFNPYNVSVDSRTFVSERQVLTDSTEAGRKNPSETWPFKFKITIAGVTYDINDTTLALGGRNANGMLLDTWFQLSSKVIDANSSFASLGLDINFRWKPGESKALGVAEREVNANVLDNYNNITRMMSGFTTDAAYAIQVNTTRGVSQFISWPDITKPLTFSGTDNMEVAIEYSNVTSPNVFFDRKDNTINNSVRKDNFLSNSLPAKKSIAVVYDPANRDRDLPLVTLAPSPTFEEEGMKHPSFVPFFSFSYGLRSLSDTLVKTKGYASHKQVIPLDFSADNIADTDISHSVFDWRMKPLTSSADAGNFQPNEGFSTDIDTSAYFGTSERADLGQNRWTIAELPTQPLRSLCELQHFDPAFLNYHYPLVANAIGNSHASPFIEPNTTQVAGTNGLDHSYIANHLLWDDWCITSLTPQTSNFAVTTDLDTVFTDVFTGNERLANDAYRPRQILTESEAQDKMNDYKGDSTSWQDVASELIVDGMFNINSTSVPAWTALLSSQLKNNPVFQEIDPAADATTLTADMLGDQVASVSRFTLNSDRDSTDAGAQNSVTAPQQWTKDQFEALAERIVEQIRLRGPFLSLSEFMNRQLSSDEDLALAGAVEAALLQYAAQGSSPYDPLLNEYTGPEFQAENHATYKFGKAGEGHVFYGTPGWARQADILRPIAPVLSARDDTFTIRAYGDARDANGNVVARARCEAIVTRGAEFVDNTDEANTPIDEISETNRRNGRRFEIVSFRWLSSDEI